MRAQTSISALFPSGKPPTTRVRRLISRLGRFDHVVRADAPAVPVRELRQQVGRGLVDPLPQAVRGGLQPPGLHLRGDGPGLVQRGFPGLHGEYRFQGRARPFAVGRRHLGERVAHEMHHAPQVSRFWRHGVDGGGQSVFCQVVIGQCGVSFPSEKAVGFSPVRNWPVIARVLLFHCIRA